MITPTSSSSSAPGFFRISSGTESLPIVQETTDRELSQASRGDPELLADFHRRERNTSCVRREYGSRAGGEGKRYEGLSPDESVIG